MLASLTLTGGVEAQPATAPTTTPAAYPPVVIEGSQYRIISSREAGKDFALQILLPASFAKEPTRTYPLIVVLDGQWDFKLLASIQGGLHYDKALPETILVGITYPGEHPDYDALRRVDLTPTPLPDRPGTGGGPKFLAFIEHELLPMLDNEYRADASQRVLIGGSLGGLFTLYTLFNRPELFSGYIASSPAIASANSNEFWLKPAFATGRTFPSARRLFVGVGELENLHEPVKEFVQALHDQPHPGVEFESTVVSQEGHTGNKPELFNRGLRYVFGGKP